MAAPSQGSQNVFFLQIRDVAAWQLPELAQKQQPPCQASLPALQRGAVWKPKQIEFLWDSLVRGFPIGAFLLAPYEDRRGKQLFLHQQTSNESAENQSSDGESLHNAPPRFHLLDGQQRANAIALGFLDIWSTPKPEAKAALWVDLEPPEARDERAVVFRVVTRSHPWGYRYQNPGERLEAGHRRTAWEAYRLARINRGGGEVQRVSQLDLSEVWPWEGKAPIPFPFLLQAVMSGKEEIWPQVQEQLENKLPYWRNDNGLFCFNNTPWKTKVKALLEKKPEYLQRLIDGLQHLFGLNEQMLFTIPAVVMPREVVSSSERDQSDSLEASPAEAPPQDPIETLFVRVNAGGTTLEGEELIYSLLKATWPDAQQLVENIGYKFMPSSRLVLLSARLMLARAERKSKSAPGSPNVERFRRLIHGRDRQMPHFLQELQNFWQNDDARWLFETARNLLCEVKDKNSNYGLPPVLAAGISNKSSPEAFYFLLDWLDRLREAELDPASCLSASEKRRLLGAVTALSWFAQKPIDCLNIFWEKLSQTHGADLLRFFSSGILKPCLNLTKQRQIQLLPLVPPNVLQDAIDSSITAAKGFKTAASNLWQDWDWWSHFAGSFNEKPKLRQWYKNHLSSWLGEEEGQDVLISAWTQFANDLRGKRELLLYAQRQALRQWFPDFDPTSPDQLEDTDRPWDLDHIHPQYYVSRKHNIPKLIREWHNSIGNLRALPLEVNRSDGAIPPRQKLDLCSQIHKLKILAHYGIRSSKELKRACFISKKWGDWRESTPDEENFKENYLALDKYHKNRCHLVRAITQRWVALYREWYESLLIGDLLA